MKLSDLLFLEATAQSEYHRLIPGLTIDGINRPLTHEEIILLSHYLAVVKYLIKKGVLPVDFDEDVKIIDIISDIKEDDYE